MSPDEYGDGNYLQERAESRYCADLQIANRKSDSIPSVTGSRRGRATAKNRLSEVARIIDQKELLPIAREAEKFSLDYLSG